MGKEQLEVSEEYKKAFNQAEMLTTFMPEVLEKAKIPVDGESPEWTKGFQARIAKFEKDKEAMKDFSIEREKQEYRKEHGSPSKEQGKDKGLDR